VSTSDQHKQRAEHNEFLRDELDNPFWDWAVSATFYAAVHYVEAYLAKCNPPVHSRNHDYRDSHILRDAKIRIIYDDYKLLKTESHDARYLPHIPFGQADVQRVQAYLTTVKDVILPLI
jgi:hypothetical protein